MSVAAAADLNDPLVLDEETELVPEEVLKLPRGNERFGYPRDIRAFELHGWLATAAGGRHAVDVCLGQLLRRMVDTRGYARWGRRNFETYVAADLRSESLRRFQYLSSIDRAIEEKPLPRIGKAWRDGRLFVSQARELIRVARPEDEERWLDLAGKVGVEKLAAHVKRALEDAKKEDPGGNDGPASGSSSGGSLPGDDEIHWV